MAQVLSHCDIFRTISKSNCNVTAVVTSMVTAKLVGENLSRFWGKYGQMMSISPRACLVAPRDD
jgi:hypothetical protein